MKTSLQAAPRYGLPLDLPTAERDHFDRLGRRKGNIWWGSATVAGKRRLERRASMLAGVLRELPAPRVLEVGCGTGAFTEQLLRDCPNLRLTSADISTECITVARRRCRDFGQVRFDVVDLLDDPYPLESFDVVAGNSILHHLHTDPFLQVLARMVRPDGLIFFFEPNMLNPQVALERHVRFVGRWLGNNTPNETAFVRWSLRHALESAGFVEVSVTPFDFLHPAVPAPFVGLVESLAGLMERTPGLREIAGSLIIRARRATR